MMKNNIYALIIIFFLFLTIGAQGQTTQLTYKTKGKTAYKANIALSNDSGNEKLSPEEFQQSDNLYFILTPASSSRKDFFKDNDVSDYFTTISLYQNGNKIVQNNVPNSYSEDKKKIDRVIISFPKDQVKLYEPFSFKNSLGESGKIQIKETFLPSYAHYQKLFDQAESLLKSKQYTQAFKTLSQIRKDAREKPEVSSFSFYKKTMQSATEASVRGFLDEMNTAYAEKQKQFTENKSKETLDACGAVLENFKETAPPFQSYLESAPEGMDKLKSHFEKVSQEIKDKYESDRKEFKKAKMALLEEGNYTTYKFYLYVDVISRMLCQEDALQTVQGLRPLDMKTLDEMPDKRDELVSTGWMDDFTTLVSFLNDNIARDKKVVSAAVLSNLNAQDSLEQQPYFEIFNAFNHLDSNPGIFYSSMNRALVKCSDYTLLNNIDMWLVSYKMTQEGINKESVANINKGIISIKSGQWKTAETIFNILKRQSNENPVPWFYSAVIQNHHNRVFSAQAQFSRALELYPHYLAPRQYLFEILSQQKEYTDLLSRADSAIAAFDIWYFHYVKAIALLNLKRTNEAVDEIKTKCIPLNKWDTKQYYLLGDAYLTQNDFDKAKAAYTITREIDPFSNPKLFDTKMKTLIKMQQQYVKRETERLRQKEEKLKQEQIQKKLQEEQNKKEQEKNKKEQPENKGGQQQEKTGGSEN